MDFPKSVLPDGAVNTVKDFFQENTSLNQVVFVCFSSPDYQIYQKIVPEILRGKLV